MNSRMNTERKGGSGLNGLLLVDKPAGITSHDVVDRLRRATGMRRIGHTGTLDPSATGLLILCLGTATRLSEHLTGLDKVYEGAMRLGFVTDSYDMDGKVLEQNSVPPLDVDQIQSVCDRFKGAILQEPPMVSAVKVGGERLYKRARQGEVVERPSRTVTVREFVVLGYTFPDVLIRVRCTRGTYVRSLCHDVGKALGCGAALATLRRTFVGHYSVDNAAQVDSFTCREDAERRLLPVDDALELPVVVISSAGQQTVAAGGAIVARDTVGGCPVQEGWVQLKSASGRLLGLGVVQTGPMGPWIHPKRVFIE